MHWYPTTRTVKRVNAEASVLATYQQSGTLWPFDTGVAYHVTAGADFRRGISLRAGAFRAPRHFVSLYGNPFFSTLSVRDGESHRGITTAYLHADYHYTFHHDYVLGAEAEAYQCWLGRSTLNPKSDELNFSFGIYLRLHPSILLKKW
jgi:hypothetical protein